MDNLLRTDYVDILKCRRKLEQFSWSKNDNNYLGVNVIVLNKDDNLEFWLKQKLTIGNTDCDHSIELRNQLTVAAEKFRKEANLSPVQVGPESNDTCIQIKLAHEIINVVHCPR